MGTMHTFNYLYFLFGSRLISNIHVEESDIHFIVLAMHLEKLFALLCTLQMSLLLRKIGDVVLSALPARFQTDDTQAYIRMEFKRG